jgi:Family of unknown function (DUF6011)
MTAAMEVSQDEMIADALKIHETEHCGGSPCTLAVKLALRLGKGGIVGHGHELQGPLPMRGGGRGHGRQVSTSATERQLDLIRKLAAERDYLSLGDTQRKLVQDVCTGTVISKRSASDLISALMVTVPADSRSMRPEFLPAEPKASDRQVAFASRLAAERGRTVSEDALRELTRSEISELIDGLLKVKVQPKAPAAELEAGMYRVGDEIFKVQRAVHGSGRMYAKLLVVDGQGDAHFEMAEGAIRKLTSEHRMSLEEAKQFGQVYGICAVCSATLTDETSIEAGIGPICAKRI